MITRRETLRQLLIGTVGLFSAAGCARLSAEAPSMAASSYRRVFLFSGHMIDAAGRATPRFPADKEAIAAAAIGAALDARGCGGGDLGICGGACGGDLLFAEAVLARGAHLQLLLPFDEQTFLSESVDFADAGWRPRFFAVKQKPHTVTQVAPEALGPLPPGANPYERENRWLLDTALAHGAQRLDFICLWDGGGGDGPGGTRHMVEQVEAAGAHVTWLDTRTLWTV
ncbi:MAG: hypothetical protein ABI629_00135 [bacterium]